MLVGICIYCGSTDTLTDEHILPYSLWGTEVLQKASCRDCAAVTTKLELHVARDLLLPVRAYMGYRSRRKSKLPQQFPLDVVDNDGMEQTLILDSKEHPAFVVFPEYDLPELLRSGRDRNGIAINGTRLISFGADLRQLAKKYNFKSLRLTSTFKATLFERFLAKWAYCIAIKRYGLDQFGEVYVTDDILGKKDTIGTFVGCDGEVIIGKQPAFGAFFISEDGQHNVMVRLKLFANSGAPEYLVVVGRLKVSEHGGRASLFLITGIVLGVIL